MWHIFAGIWQQRNDILHEKTIGTTIERMDSQLQRIYRFRSHYFRDSDLDLFHCYDLPTALHLPPSVKSRWLHTLHIAVRCRHKSITCLNRDPQHTIDTYFTPTTT
jgi:hypothetical protein